MDLLEHAAGVWARKWIILGVAILVAIGVYGWRSTAPEQYEATTTVQIRLPDTYVSDPSSAVVFYAQTVGGLATTRTVVDRALQKAGRDDVPEEAVDEVSAELGSGPSFVEISAFGASPQEAVDLTDALADLLVEEVATNQADDLAAQRAAVTQAIADLGRDRRKALSDGTDPFEKAALEREREALLGSLRTISEKTPWRLSVVAPAVLPTSPTAPTPLRDALLALILVLILGAELVVARRAWRGSLSARDAAKDAGDVARVPGLVVRPDASAAALTPLLPALGSTRAVNVVQIGREAQARTAGLLAELLAARGDDVLLLDANRSRPAVHAEYGVAVAPGLAELRRSNALSEELQHLPRVRSLSVLAAGQAELAHGDRRLSDVIKTAPQERVAVSVSVASIDDFLDVVGDLDGPTVLDVEAGTSKRRLRAEVATLRGLGFDLVAVTVSTGRRGARSGTPRRVAAQV